MDCGCERRKQWLNQQRPGLGDRVERAIKWLAIPAAAVMAWAFWRIHRAQ
jgi:hypothetical protein